MPPYKLLYHPEVARDDLPQIPRNLRRRLSRALEARLTTAPEKYGLPLRGSLRGLWKLRVGDYRVVFKVVEQEIWVFAILNRKVVYDLAGGRAAWMPR